MNTPNLNKLELGHTFADLDDNMPKSILSDCEAYGMAGGCDEYCPVLIAGKCKLQDTVNAELYKKAMARFPTHHIAHLHLIFISSFSVCSNVLNSHNCFSVLCYNLFSLFIMQLI